MTFTRIEGIRWRRSPVLPAITGVSLALVIGACGGSTATSNKSTRSAPTVTHTNAPTAQAPAARPEHKTAAHKPARKAPTPAPEPGASHSESAAPVATPEPKAAAPETKAAAPETKAPAPEPKAATPEPKAAAPEKKSPESGGIPQGNAGDQDADNNGGPSDGDGNI